MTQSLQQQKPLLGSVASETFNRLATDLNAANAPRDVPASHDLVLFVHGRVLSDPQLEKASCCIPSEAHISKEAYARTAWRVPTVDPLLKEPSSLFPDPTGAPLSPLSPFSRAPGHLRTILEPFPHGWQQEDLDFSCCILPAPCAKLESLSE